MPDDGDGCLVLVNSERKYLIWPNQRELPSGWRPVGKQGARADCLRYLDDLWANGDAFTLSLRIETAARNDGK